MADVFISYARSSEPQAEAIVGLLRDAGYSVWIDRELPSHRAYSDVIAEQIGQAKAVLVIWSAEAAQSHWVRSEANRGRADNKLVQLKLDDTRLPMPFDQIQCSKLIGWTGDTAAPGWRKASESIAHLVGATRRPAAPSAHTPRTTGEPILAVLPFDNLSGDSDLAEVCDGVSEDVIQSLMGSPGVKLIGRTASFRFRGELKASAAQVLAASHILDGSIRRSGSRVRVSAHLTEAATGTALWGERWDREVSDLFALQDEIAALIAKALRGPLAELAASEPSDDSNAELEDTGPSVAPEGERRHLTVLACGFATSGEGADRLDLEQRRELWSRCQPLAAEVAARMGGYVAKGRHEELIAYFGYPEAQEDASERAVRAGLAIQQAMADLNAQIGREQDVRFEVRCAIHAGTVVVTQSTAEGAEIFGDTPEIAAKARVAASPDTVVMTAVVHDLVSGLFVIEDLGDRAVLDSGDPQHVYRVVRPGLAGSRPRGFSPRETSPFVGRDDELALLMSRWRCVQDGEGQFVLVTGEPGIGKSRLVEEFRTRMKGDPHLWISCGGGPLFTNTPLHPVVRMLDQGLGWRGDESPEERLSGLERALRPLGARTAEAVPLIAGLLNLPTPGGGQSPMFAPDQARRRLLEALAAWVFGATRDQPLVAVVEDLHWVDPSTLELIQTLLEQGATAPLMLLCTARPEFRPTWTPRGHHAHITLNRLNNRQTRELVSQVVARSGLVKDVVERVLRRTDGVPLFAEELTRLMLEGDEAPGGHAVPATLLDSLAARLDRVGRAKETAQLASVIGRDFSYELLRAVSQASDTDLDGDLGRLADAELIYARGLPPHASYQFKHALMQDAAYQALLKSTRRELHGRVARTLAERFPALADAQPEILARHWTEAGEAAPAIDAWQKAGDAAYARRAFKEAEEDYHQALAIQEALPESSEGDARTLALLSALNRILQLTRGYAAPETVAAATRARSLAEKTGSISQLIREEAVLWRGIITSGDYAGAAAMADHILDLTHRAPPSPARLLFAHNAQVQTRYYTGDLAGVEEHFALLSPLIESDGRRQAPGNNIVAIGIASLTAFLRGYRTLAETRIASAAAFAEKTGNPYDLAMALHFESGLRIMERDVDRAETLAQRMMEVGEENGFSYIMDLAAPKMGWVRAHQGAPEEGLELVRRGLAGVSASGARIAITLLYNSLAEIQAMTGAVSDALDVIEVGLNANPQELIFRPEALMLRGTFRANLGDMTLAEADFREALALAGRIDSAIMALRAALRLAPLMRSRGEGDAATALIAAHRDRVRDGAGTRVMLEAEAALRAA